MPNEEKLVYMANQIAKFFAAQGEARAVAGVANHLNQFWDPEMRRELLAHAAKDDSGLHAFVKAALPEVKQPLVS